MIETYAFAGFESWGRVVDERLQAQGFVRAERLADADAVITYCVTQTELEDVYFDTDGVVQVAKPGAVVIDLSASTPSFAREIGAVATVNDLHFAEAPLAVCDMFADDALADAGNLVGFVSGDDTAVRLALPVVRALAATVHETGVAGSAQLAKAAWTLRATSCLAAAVEAQALFHVAQHAGLAFDAGLSAPGSDAFADAWRAIVEERFEGTYTVEILLAELSAALMAADDYELILPHAESCAHMLELMALIGGADKSPAALSLAYGDEAACAAHGLDWTRAEQAYSDGFDDDEYDDDLYDCDFDCDDCDDDCCNEDTCSSGRSHRHGHGGLYSGFSMN
ncbi:NAD(P)-binding domain-containing protein [Adlercreutzia sp. ZJ138]|uniref:NAD(P)-binding domain-containing protein n=1 Tax=Adlercreutzia sp. ZJ138 TaxID=2709405 RepID=UPI0013EA46B4|nr:NAD(P)-binding domain-containing protein [Adlercreutzia sp. ZJ138]